MSLKPGFVRFQIGKQGITEGVLESLRLALKNHKQVRISFLKSTKRDKAKMEELAKELQEKLGAIKYRIIGFTVIIKKAKR